MLAYDNKWNMEYYLLMSNFLLNFLSSTQSLSTQGHLSLLSQLGLKPTSEKNKERSEVTRPFSWSSEIRLFAICHYSRNKNFIHICQILDEH